MGPRTSRLRCAPGTSGAWVRSSRNIARRKHSYLTCPESSADGFPGLIPGGRPDAFLETFRTPHHRRFRADLFRTPRGSRGITVPPGVPTPYPSPIRAPCPRPGCAPHGHRMPNRAAWMPRHRRELARSPGFHGRRVPLPLSPRAACSNRPETRKGPSLALS